MSCSERSTSGTLWSENGIDSNRWPLGQLETRQKTMALVMYGQAVGE
jgi:hypothetical protein